MKHFLTIRTVTMLFVLCGYPAIAQDTEEPSYNGKTVSQWIGNLKSAETASERRNAANALAEFGPLAKDAIPALINFIGDENISIRTSIGSALSRIGADSVPALMNKLRGEKNPTIRYRAAFILGTIGPAAKDSVHALTDALKDEDDLVRSYAASSIGHIGFAVKDTVAALIHALDDKHAGVRSQAAFALGSIRLAPNKAIPALIIALKDEDPNVRLNASSALGRFGSAAKEAVPSLIVLLNDKLAELRIQAAKALRGCSETNLCRDRRLR